MAMCEQTLVIVQCDSRDLYLELTSGAGQSWAAAYMWNFLMQL